MATYYDFEHGNTRPDFAVEFSTADPLDTPAWEDIGQQVRAFSFRRGRADELTRIEAGTATILLDNDDRAFDPTYTSSSYYPDVVPMRRVRLLARWSGVEYPLWYGLAMAWTPVYGGATGNDAYVQMGCVDLFEALALFPLSGAEFAEEPTGTRIGNVLTEIGWPAGERTLDTGNHTAAAEVADATTGLSPAVGSALTYMQEVAYAEGGLLFIGPDGKVVFRDRRDRTDDRTSSTVTFGDGSSPEINYTMLGTDYDSSALWTDVIVNYRPSHYHPVATFEQAYDATASGRFVRRNRTLTTRTPRPGEAQAIASLELLRGKTPALRYPSVTVEPVGTEWASILGREISDRVTVTRRPPGGGTITIAEHIEGITHTVTPWRWEVSYDLSPALTYTEWVVGTSALGTNTYIGV